MADLTLGLDIGARSIGWALLDEAGEKVLHAGVRVFPEGVDREKSGAEKSKNATRREARGARRQIARRAKRKRRLRRALVAARLLPPEAGLARDDPRRAVWERDAFQQADPYTLRAAVRSQRLDPYDIGRILVHLNQRRGFRSNRKGVHEVADKQADDESKMLAEISQLESQLKGQTLGEHLAALLPTDPRRRHEVRLRGRHTRRSMFEDEFRLLWEAQSPHHPELLTDSLRSELHGILFFQRDLYWPKSVIGRCELLPRLPRCPRADRRAQRFRLFVETANLQAVDLATGEDLITPELRRQIRERLAGVKEATFDRLRKKFFPQRESVRFNLEAGERKKLKGLPTDALLSGRSCLGRAWWEIDEQLRDRIVAALIDGDESRLRHAAAVAGLDEAAATKLLGATHGLEAGYMSYSLAAIKGLLPYLEAGLPLSSRDRTIPSALRAAALPVPWERDVQRQPFLPHPPQVTNPLVRAALHEVRKVVNAILRELVYRDGHTLSHIRLELAREVRGNAEQRSLQSKQMRDRESHRDAAAERIREHGVKVTRDAIERYLLWQEQREVCVYSGQPISVAQLLGGEVDVDHVLPYSRSLDDSQLNKVVCFRRENDEKGNRTPWEWLGEAAPERFEQIALRARVLPLAKLRRFFQKQLELEDFFARQFADTTYITTQAMDFLKCLGTELICPKGQHTATLRYLWGLNTVLGGDRRSKPRDDHRHHAVDAVVIALTSRRTLQALSAARRHGQTEDQRLAPPWEGFRRDVEAVIGRINVSHRVRRKVSGALHEESQYGPTARPDQFVLRKRLEDLTPPMVAGIVDPQVRRLVMARLQKHGIDPNSKGKIPKSVWVEPLRMTGKRSNDDGHCPQIRKVRVQRNDKTIQPLGPARYVKPGRNHHVCIFEVVENGRAKRIGRWTSMLEAARRVRSGETVIQRNHPDSPQARFLMSLSPGDSVQGVFKGIERLAVFQTGASTSGQLHFADHADARPAKEREEFTAYPSTLQAHRIVVDPIGRIRRVGD